MSDESHLLPTVISFIACERVILDHFVAQYSVIGITFNLRSHVYPVAMPPMGLFCEFTNGRGVTPLTFRISSVNEERPPVLEMNVQANLVEPLAVVQCIFYTPGMVFPEPGGYRIEMWSRGSLLAQRPLVAVQMVPGPEGGWRQAGEAGA